MSENRLVRLVLPVLGLALLIAAWHAYVVAFDVPVAVLPRPALVLDSMIANWRLIVSEGWITLLESLYGFVLAFALGVPLAVAIAGSRTLNLMFYPLLIATQSLPKVALAPLILVWLGTGMESKLAIAWLVAFFPIVVDTATGLAQHAGGIPRSRHGGAGEPVPDLLENPFPGGAALRHLRLEGGDHARGDRRGDRRVHRLERRARQPPAGRQLADQHSARLRLPDRARRDRHRALRRRGRGRTGAQPWFGEAAHG